MHRHRYGRSRRYTSRAQDALTEEQLDALLAAVNVHTTTGTRNLALLLVMAHAGLRVSEATGMCSTDVVTMAAGPLMWTSGAAKEADLGGWLSQAEGLMRLGRGRRSELNWASATGRCSAPSAAAQPADTGPTMGRPLSLAGRSAPSTCASWSTGWRVEPALLHESRRTR